MDFEAWKRFKRSGTYRREVKRQYKDTVSSSSTQIPSSQSQVRDQVAQSGSVPNTFFAYEELEKHSNVDSDSRSDSSTDDKNRQLRDGLKNWAVNYNISHDAIKSLIVLINDRIPNILPSDPRTLLNTEKSVTTHPVGNGRYWHNGLTKTLKCYLQIIDSSLSIISLNINIDGLPAFKSSKLQLWPILCNVHEIPKLRPIVIGIYSGTDKPSDLDSYLRLFVDEMKQLLANGLSINSNEKEKKICIKIRAFICDSPARAMIKGKLNFTMFSCLQQIKFYSITLIKPGFLKF